MNRERIEEWVAALRSGEYTQGRNHLKHGKVIDNRQYHKVGHGGVSRTVNYGPTEVYTHCCLGVGCELAKYSLQLTWRRDGENAFYCEVPSPTDKDTLLEVSSIGSMPKAVSDWFGIEYQGGALCKIDSVAIFLSRLNDGATLGLATPNGAKTVELLALTFLEIADIIEARYLTGAPVKLRVALHPEFEERVIFIPPPYTMSWDDFNRQLPPTCQLNSPSS